MIGFPCAGGCLPCPSPGEECVWCGEPVTASDLAVLATMDVSQTIHPYCVMRALFGSVGHQMGWCRCFGGPGTMDDPPGVSLRLAARLAAVVMKARHGAEPYVVCPKCGWTSFNRDDIAQRYCAHCHDWHSPALVPLN